jgi:3-methyladenine DNA glycosylase AlkD
MKEFFSMKSIIERVSQVKHGFRPMEIEAQILFESKSREECFAMSEELLENEAYQVRSVGVFLLGYIACNDISALEILKNKVSKDSSWQVQEILAKAFDKYCEDIGYETALPTIKEWLKSDNPNICRAVTEGLRIWTGRSFFKTHPEVAIKLISQHKANESIYLRKSVGNSLRDISKSHMDLIASEVSTWDLSDKRILFTFKLVMKSK